MPLAVILQLLPVLLQALTPLLQQLAGAHAAGDLTAATSIAGSLTSSITTIQQAGALVATLQADGNRDPTPAEWAPFDAAFAAANAQVQADVSAAPPVAG